MATPDPQQIFRDSLDRCRQRDDFLDLFYERFMDSSEEVREKFARTDFALQKQRLLKALTLAADVIDGDARAMRHLHERAESHGRHGLDIKAGLYDFWLESLMTTASECDPNFNEEIEVAESAKVSRTPVREAMHRLEAEGLIRFVPNQGAFVTSWGNTEAEETFDLRAMLESYAAGLCAERATEADLAAMRELAERQLAESRNCRRGHLKRIADLNSQFHELLLQASSSERVRASMATLANAPLVFQTFRDYSKEDLTRSAQHHLELVEALEARNPDWARAVMRAHIFAARSVFRNRHGLDAGDPDRRQAAG